MQTKWIRLLLVFLFVVFLEVCFFSSWSAMFRVDLFLGMVIGLAVFCPFSHGIAFVFVASVLMQAFSGVATGGFALVYVFSFIFLDMIKDVIYLENVPPQCVLGFLLYVMIFFVLSFMTGNPLNRGTISSVLLGAVFTGMTTPLMVRLVSCVWGADER
ncbi:MAG: hypothetical protein U9P80_08645 [Thermodesulfobacteriota bacterium]|nr:hypothetical protein [Thermodesulfobacteriota bacterium]